MAWFGEGLSSLKGQITSFTKEVLSEGRDDVFGTSSDELTASQKKVEELTALCASQDLEISELRQRNAELQRRLGAGDTALTDELIAGLHQPIQDEGGSIMQPKSSHATNQTCSTRCHESNKPDINEVVPPEATSGTRQSATDLAQHARGEIITPSLHSHLSPDTHSGLGLHPPTPNQPARPVCHLEKGVSSLDLALLGEPDSFLGTPIPHEQDDLAQVLENAKQELAEKTYLVETFRQQLDNLKAERQHVNAKCSHLEDQLLKLTSISEPNELDVLRSQLKTATEQLAQSRDENPSALKEQLKVAEMRIEELEKELQRVQQQMLDHLSDSQSNVSEIRGEVEQTRWQLLQESGAQKTEHLRARQDMVNRIIQMGEKSREVEMNMKKLQMDGKHVTADIVAIIHKLGDPAQQEIIHGALKALELENQVLKLRNAQLELAGNTESLKTTKPEFERRSEEGDMNMKYQEVDSSKFSEDWDAASLRSEVSELSLLKHKLETQVSELETQVEKYERDMEYFQIMKTDWAEEKQLLQLHLSDLKQQLREKEEKLNVVTAQKGLSEVKKQASDESSALQTKVQELSAEKEQLKQESVCMSSELEAMAKIVQDLESQLAKSQAENSTLTQNLEDLDEQHQGAIEQLLNVKQSLQQQNDSLQNEVKMLKEQKINSSQQHNEQLNQGIQTSIPHLHQEAQTEISSDVHAECRKNLEQELQEKLSKLVTFEIPQNYYHSSDIAPIATVEALVKMCVEFKWKRDTLERKVAELMKDLRESKQKYEQRDKEARLLEKDCKDLKGNVETLIEELMMSKTAGGESLAPIPENSEETEAMEQRILALENEVQVLREARLNLELDANRLREENHGLVRELNMVNATLRHNQENLQTEIERSAADTETKLQEALSEKQNLEALVKDLESKLKFTEESKTATDSDTQEIVAKNQALQQKLEELSAVNSQVNASLELQVKDLQNQLQDTAELHRVVADTDAKLKEVVSAKQKVDEELKDLQSKFEASMESSSQIEMLQQQLQEVQNIVADSEVKVKEAVSAKQILEEEVKALQNKLEASVESSSQAETFQQQLLQAQEAMRALEKSCKNLHLPKEDLEKEMLQRKNLEELFQNSQVDLQEKSRQLEEAQQQVQYLQEQVNCYTQEISSWKIIHSESEKQLRETQQSKTALENELKSLRESFQMVEKDLAGLKSEKLSLEESVQQDTFAICAELQSQLSEKETEIQNLRAEVERSTAHNNEAMAQSVKKWKHMAEATEKELNEMFAVREELEKECKKLYSIESKVQNQEHLERELQRMREANDELEQQCNHLQSEMSASEQKCIELAVQIRDLQELQGDVTDQAAHLEEQLNATLQEKHFFQGRCQELQSAEERARSLEQEAISRKEAIFALQTELSEISEAKSNLEAECKRLLSVEGRLRILENLEKEVVELREKVSSLQTELDETVKAKQLLEAQTEEGGQLSTCGIEPKNLQEQAQGLQVVLDEKIDEIEILRKENSRLKEIESEQKLEEKRKFQDNEAAEMSRETIANLSKIIKDKDLEIEALKQKSETLLNLLQQQNAERSPDNSQVKEIEVLKQELERLTRERVELITTIQMKHHESMQYHGEMQRLSALLGEEMKKVEALQSQQDLSETQALRSQIAALQDQLVKATQPTSSPVSLKEIDMDSLPDDLRMQMETLQAECTRMADSLLQEQTRYKYLQNEVQEQHEKESSHLKELERLRQHLMEVEESYTSEALRAEEQVKDLQSKLAQAEERIRNSSTAYTSANIRANQHVESLQEQTRLITQQRDEIQQKLSASEDLVQHHTAALRNLQVVLEQFQKDKEREISAATERLQQQLQAAQRRHEELHAEIAALKDQLSEAKDGLSAAARLGEQLDRKTETINSLKEEVSKLSAQLQEAESRVQSASLNVEGKVDRYLVKNLVLGYFMAPPNNRDQVLRVIATVLDFNQEERDRVGIDSTSSGSGWFKSILQPGKGPANMQSLSEAFIQFLEKESRPQPQLRLLPEGQEAPVPGNSRSESPASSTGGSQRRSPLLLADMQLPTFSQFPVSRNSSSILKDVLKES